MKLSIISTKFAPLIFSIFFFCCLFPLATRAYTEIWQDDCKNCAGTNGICPLDGGPKPPTTPKPPTPGNGCINAPNIPQEMQDAIKAAAQAFGLDPAFLASIQQQECNGDYSSCGADGPFQITPGTWPGIATDGNGDGATDRTNVWDAAFSAANYLASFNASMQDSAAMYNGGGGCCASCGCFEDYDGNGLQYWQEVMDRFNQIKC